MATVNIMGVSKFYNSQPILEHINLNIEKGEFVAIVGPSGCGKSTLLRLVAGLDAVSSGSILINNQCVNKTPPASRDMAMVFQTYALYPHMTVYDNMAYGLKMRGMKKNLIKERVQEVAQLLQLEDFLLKKPALLSGGQRQRVAMGRAIVRSPAVFLFDEPLSNLDSKLRTEMRHEIKKLHQKLNTTCIYVTHDQTEAMTLADRVVVLNKGKIEQVGTPRELYDRPATLFVAGFIGHYPMNFISGAIDATNKVFISKIGSVHPLQMVDNSISPHDSTTLGVRPEHVTIVPQPGSNSISCHIEFVDDMGVDKLVQLRTDCGNLRLSVRIPGNEPVNGPNVHVNIDMSHVNVFSQPTGHRLK